jgi:HD-GYP domain-containing protein (c-di-GMP phosphodiesterase class II)
MNQENITCPVCHIILIPGATQCPDCGKDLSALFLLQHESEVLFNKSLVLVSEEKEKEAADTLAYLLQIDPKNINAVNLLGKLYANLGAYGEATRLWKHYLEQMPEEKSFGINLAVVQEAIEKDATYKERADREKTKKATIIQLGQLVGMIFIGAILLIGIQHQFGILSPGNTSVSTAVVAAMNTAALTVTNTAIPTTQPITKQPPVTPQPIKTIVPTTMPPTTTPTLLPTATPDLVQPALSLLAKQEKFSEFNLTINQKGSDTISVIGKIDNFWKRYEIELLLLQLPGVNIVDLRNLTFERYYTVKANDTPSEIALKVYGDWKLWKKILEYNQIHEPYIIYEGLVLKIP